MIVLNLKCIFYTFAIFDEYTYIQHHLNSGLFKSGKKWIQFFKEAKIGWRTSKNKESSKLVFRRYCVSADTHMSINVVCFYILYSEI